MFTISLRWLLGMVFVPLKSQDLGDASLTVVSVFIDKKATLFDQFLLQPLFVSARIARVLVEKQVSQPIRKLL